MSNNIKFHNFTVGRREGGREGRREGRREGVREGERESMWMCARARAYVCNYKNN